jgi:D-amino-acid dehydrogenase
VGAASAPAPSRVAGAPIELLQWLGREDAPPLFRLRADRRQWPWGLQFLRECTPARNRHNIRQIVALGTYSRSTLQQLRGEPGLQHDQRVQGILHVCTDKKAFDAAHALAALLRAPGGDRRVISADDAVRLEPTRATTHARGQLAGASTVWKPPTARAASSACRPTPARRTRCR